MAHSACSHHAKPHHTTHTTPLQTKQPNLSSHPSLTLAQTHHSPLARSLCVSLAAQVGGASPRSDRTVPCTSPVPYTFYQCTSLLLRRKGSGRIGQLICTLGVGGTNDGSEYGIHLAIPVVRGPAASHAIVVCPDSLKSGTNAVGGCPRVSHRRHRRRLSLQAHSLLAAR